VVDCTCKTPKSQHYQIELSPTEWFPVSMSFLYRTQRTIGLTLVDMHNVFFNTSASVTVPLIKLRHFVFVKNTTSFIICLLSLLLQSQPSNYYGLRLILGPFLLLQSQPSNHLDLNLLDLHFVDYLPFLLP